jgi:glycosyltransferase involved in cell wall biosynthesis
MRVIYLHQYFTTPDMAGGTRSFEMARRMVAAGHQVEMVTTIRDDSDLDGGDWRVTEESGIRVHWLPVPYSNRMGFIRRVWAFVRFAFRSASKAASLRGDVIFATSTPLTIAIPGVWASRRQGIPMVFEVRDLWPELPVAIGAIRSPVLIWLAERLERWAYRNSKRLVALSPGMRDGVVRTGYPEAHVSIVPNSCDIDLFGVAKEGDLLAVQRMLPWLGNRKLVVYTGTFGALNNSGYLIRIAHSMVSMDSEVRFLLVGDGADFEYNTELATSLGVLGHNLFILKSMPKRDLTAVVRRATVATSLFVNIREMWANSANKFFDALAAGKPVMINYRGWQAELLLTSGAGIVVPTDDPHAAATALLELLSDDTRLARASEASRKLAREEFSRDILADRLIKVLEDAVRPS